MKMLFMSFFLLMTGISIYAQPAAGVVVRGQIVDSLSQEPVSFATVKIFSEQQKTTPVKVGATDENGYFRLELKTAGSYLLNVEYLGKNPITKPFAVADKKDLDWGKITMSNNAQLLKEVTVTAQRALVKVDLDKITYTMEEDPESKTNNVLEMLKKVPMVTVDGEENIQVKGSSNFKFYINGKPSNMLSNNPKDVLRSIPANTVKNVEVITEPGAKYDAEGVAGIINIVMQSQSSLGGYTVSMNASASSLGQLGGGSYFSVKYGKIGVTGNINYVHIQNPKLKNSTFRENYNNDENRFLTQNGSSKLKGNVLMGYGELSYEIDTLNLINVNISDRGIAFNGDQFTDVQLKKRNNDDVYHYEQSADLKNTNSGITLGADYQRIFSVKERMLTASYKLDFYNNDQDFLSRINPLLNFRSSQNRQFNFADSYEHTFQLDYTTPFAKIHSLETGLKFIKRINTSRSGLSIYLPGEEWRDVPSDNDKFRHIQDIWAAYAGYSLKYKKWGLKTGIRYEGTQMDVDYPSNAAQKFKADYSNLVPSITATYLLKPNQTFRAGYNLRIQRPGITYLNPYINTTDTNNIRFGNPKLEVVKYHNFNVNYNLYTPKFTMNANLSYGFTNEGISDFTWIDDYISKTSYYNLLKEKRWNLSSYLSWTPSMKWRIFGNLSGTYSRLQSNKLETFQENSGFSGNVSGGVQYTLPKDYALNLNTFGVTPSVALQGKGMSFYYYNLSLSKSLLNKRLNIRVGFANLFNKNLKIKQIRESADFYQATTTIQPFRQIGITVSYRFGEMKSQIKKAQRTIQNDDQIQSESSNSVGNPTGSSVPQSN